MQTVIDDSFREYFNIRKMRRLTQAEKEEAFRLHLKGATNVYIAEKYGTSPSTISNLFKRKKKVKISKKKQRAYYLKRKEMIEKASYLGII